MLLVELTRLLVLIEARKHTGSGCKYKKIERKLRYIGNKRYEVTTHSTNNNIHILNDIDVITIVSFDPSN
jgi:hypothetical protein